MSPFLSVKKLSGRPARGSEPGFRGWEGEEEFARVPEELAEGVPSGEGAEDLAQGGGCRPEGAETVGGETAALKEAVVARVRCRRRWGGAWACAVVVRARPEPKGVVGREGMSGGKLDRG